MFTNVLLPAVYSREQLLRCIVVIRGLTQSAVVATACAVSDCALIVVRFHPTFNQC